MNHLRQVPARVLVPAPKYLSILAGLEAPTSGTSVLVGYRWPAEKQPQVWSCDVVEKRPGEENMSNLFVVLL